MDIFDPRLNPESFNMETNPPESEGDEIEEVRICPICQGEVKDRHCLYCDFEIN